MVRLSHHVANDWDAIKEEPPCDSNFPCVNEEPPCDSNPPYVKEEPPCVKEEQLPCDNEWSLCLDPDSPTSSDVSEQQCDIYDTRGISEGDCKCMAT